MYALVNRTAGMDRCILAYHEKKKVVNKYLESISKYDESEKYSLQKVNSSFINAIPDSYDYYLIPYKTSYIQAKYYGYVREDSIGIIHEYSYVKDVLKRIYEFEKLTKENRKHIEKVIMLLSDLIQDEKDEIPSPSELKQIDELYNQYRYRVESDFGVSHDGYSEFW